MYIKLTLQEKLKDERTSRHMTLAELEKATGIARATLGKYESDNCKDISPFNLAKLAEYYGLSMDYLMGLTENKNHPNTSLYELHLNDSMVDLLKSGALNNPPTSHHRNPQSNRKTNLLLWPNQDIHIGFLQCT